MGVYSANVTTTSNANTGTAIQILAASGKDIQILGVGVNIANQSGTQTAGLWVLDRLTALDASNGSTFVPLKMDPTSATSTITSTSKTISTTLAIVPTVGDSAVVQCPPGITWFVGNDKPFALRAGAGNGWALRRATAPSGSQVVDCYLYWLEL